MRFNRIFLCFLLPVFLLGCRDQRSGVYAPRQDEQRITEENFIDVVCFLGDSTTAHMRTRAPLSEGPETTRIWETKNRFLNLDSKITHAKILCPGTDTEMTIAEVASRVRPGYLIITLGIDYGVYYFRNEPMKFKHCYEKLLDVIETASPDTAIILQSVFPVGRGSAIITNDMVDKANELIATIAAQKGLYFFNTNPLLKDDEGYLSPDYCSSIDGIHLTEKAYQIIFKKLKESEGLIKETKK